MDDNPTRRLDRSELPREGDGETRRLEPSSGGALRCIRCNNIMVETTIWASVPQQFLGPNGAIKATLRNQSPTQLDSNAASCYSMSCLNCGYTELYTDPDTLIALMLNKQSDDDLRELREDRKRNSRR